MRPGFQQIVGVIIQPMEVIVVIRGHRHNNLLLFIVIVEGAVAFKSIRIVIVGRRRMHLDVLVESVNPTTLIELHRRILFTALAVSLPCVSNRVCVQRKTNCIAA
jgi:predicted phosphatase